MMASNDFSGLTSWPWALASAAAMVPILSLQRCIVFLRLLEVKRDGTRFGTPGADAVPNRFLGILRYERFELGFRALMLQEGLPGATIEIGKFGPGIRGAHIHDPNSFDAGLRWF